MRAVTVVTTALRANTILILCLTLDALDGNSQEKHEFYSTFLKVKKKEKKKRKSCLVHEHWSKWLPVIMRGGCRESTPRSAALCGFQPFSANCFLPAAPTVSSPYFVYFQQQKSRKERFGGTDGQKKNPPARIQEKKGGGTRENWGRSGLHEVDPFMSSPRSFSRVHN